MKRLKAVDLKRDMLVEEYMANGTWVRARIVAIMKRKTKTFPNGRVVIDVLRDTGGVECRDEIGLNEVGKYLRLIGEPTIPRVDLLTASPQVFCETLFLASKLGVTDAMMNNEERDDIELAELLCVSKHYLYEHMRSLHEAYEAGRVFMEMRGKKPPWSLTRRADVTEHGSYSVVFTQGKRS